MPAGTVKPAGRGNSFKTAAASQPVTGAEEGAKVGNGAGVALWPGAGGTTSGAEGVACGAGLLATGEGLATGTEARGVGMGLLPGSGETGAGPQAVRLTASNAERRNRVDVFIKCLQMSRFCFEYR